MRKTVLVVAEKPSIAKEIAKILHGAQPPTVKSFSKYNPVYHFDCYLSPSFGETSIFCTSVTGHLKGFDFATKTGWMSCDPIKLFDAPVISSVKEKDRNGKRSSCPDIAKNLALYGKKSKTLIVATDNDREGENIGFEIIDECRKVNNKIDLRRLTFTAVTKQQITQAFRNLKPPDKRKSDACDARAILDLRIGAVFTRFQTLRLQAMYQDFQRQGQGQGSGQVISYGGCQFPTLGFVVERYKQIQSFVCEDFWKIEVKHEVPAGQGEKPQKTIFTWDRGRTFDQPVAQVLCDICERAGQAKVTDVKSSPRTKFRPVGLTTTVMQQTASRRFKLSPARTLQIAEALYNRGILSYPRTETESFTQSIDLRALVNEQVGDPRWGSFASNVLAQGPSPRNGSKTDEAHPPIHPTKSAQGLNSEESKIYELVARYFLACCSRDAKYSETKVAISIATESFHVSGRQILDKGYLEVFPYDSLKSSTIPTYQVDQTFEPTSITLCAGETSPPELLTESDLLGLMARHEIGTDATMAEHINTIQNRDFVRKHQEKLVPTTLGIALVNAYDAMSLEISFSKPHLRREMETDLKAIVQGTKTRDGVMSDSVKKYRDVYVKVKSELDKFDEAVASQLGPPSGAPPPNYHAQYHAHAPAPAHAQPGVQHAPPQQQQPVQNGDDDDDDLDDSAFLNVEIPEDIEVISICMCRSYLLFLLNSQNEVMCDCGSASVVRTVSKAGPNEGRQFRGCGKMMQDTSRCNFFQWLDNDNHGRQQHHTDNHNNNNSEDAVMCDCNTPSATRTVNKSGPNEGRQFRSCSKNMQDDSRCDFFQWVDGDHGGQSFNQPVQDDNAEGAVMCNCSAPATIRTVSKKGANEGRQFRCCAKRMQDDSRCDFFQWMEDNNGESTGGRNNHGNHGYNNGGGKQAQKKSSGRSASSSKKKSSAKGGVMCNCGLTASVKVVQKEGSNKGRNFQCCGKPYGPGGDRCNFFEWCD
eukprot:m.193912 g.193912  ORF g.193912 m.193912 type:complete len:982 (+) comp15669_c1_seq5:201-3146(+)